MIHNGTVCMFKLADAVKSWKSRIVPRRARSRYQTRQYWNTDRSNTLAGPAHLDQFAGAARYPAALAMGEFSLTAGSGLFDGQSDVKGACMMRGLVMELCRKCGFSSRSSRPIGRASWQGRVWS